MKVRIIGGGLAGCEAAYLAARLGHRVELYEMKKSRKSPAHKSDMLSELVCSNSLRSDRIQNGAGLLKAELRLLGSFLMEAADKTAVPAGGALAVDRKLFSEYVTNAIYSNPNIDVIETEVESVFDDITEENPVIIATGPLTDGKLMDSINELMGEPLHFFDAAAPIVTRESLNFGKVFEGSRYNRGSDYLNCPMNEQEYRAFVHELVNAQTQPLHEFENGSVFEGCMPVEVMAKRGEMTLCYGPMKPVGLEDDRSDNKPFAVVQLRREDNEGTKFNLVGFQTNLKFGEQRRVFGMIPGLENAEFLRYGVMHRNSFLNSPGKLNSSYGVKTRPGLYFAGQITGVEGYVESISSGYVAALSACRAMNKQPVIDFPQETAMGALSHYVSEYSGSDFQPQNINFGLITPLDRRIRNKQERYTAIAERAIEIIKSIATEINNQI